MVVAGGHEIPEGIRTRARLFRGFSRLIPPLRRQVREIVMRKTGGEQMGRAADIAGERRLLADLVHDGDRHLVNAEDGLRGLQGTRKGRDDDARQHRVREPRRGRRRLLQAERRQFRVFDPRIDARLVEHAG